MVGTRVCRGPVNGSDSVFPGANWERTCLRVHWPGARCPVSREVVTLLNVRLGSCEKNGFVVVFVMAFHHECLHNLCSCTTCSWSKATCVTPQWCKGGAYYGPPFHQRKGGFSGVRGVLPWCKGGSSLSPLPPPPLTPMEDPPYTSERGVSLAKGGCVMSTPLTPVGGDVLSCGPPKNKS
jgi:hypothetical protein